MSSWHRGREARLCSLGILILTIVLYQEMLQRAIPDLGGVCFFVDSRNQAILRCVWQTRHHVFVAFSREVFTSPPRNDEKSQLTLHPSPFLFHRTPTAWLST